MLSRRRFDVDEYQAMLRAGVLNEDDRVELIDGEIVQMTAIGARHAACVQRLLRLLVPVVGDPGRIRIQSPLRIGKDSSPEPDLAVLRPSPDDYASGHPVPNDLLLLIEVAESSLPFDRGVKLPLYARAGVPEVWIIDLNSDAVEVHRQPESDGYRFSERLVHGSVAPEAFPEDGISVRDLLPPQSE